MDTDCTPELTRLYEIINLPSIQKDEFTHVKKDIFHAFHMLPIPVNHSARPAILHALRDHLMRWDPVSCTAVDKVCCQHFNLTFNQMLLQNPRFIAKRTPRHVPPPSILVPAIEHVYAMFENAVDLKSGASLFTIQFCAKANPVLDLAHQGYLSDLEGIPLYEWGNIDKYGLQIWICT